MDWLQIGDDLRFVPEKNILTCDGKEAHTSDLAQITLSGEERIDALIPVGATKFAYVYPCEWLARSGFLYWNDDWKVLGLNPLSFNDGFFGFQFSLPQTLSDSDEIMRSHEGWHAVTLTV